MITTLAFCWSGETLIATVIIAVVALFAFGTINRVTKGLFSDDGDELDRQTLPLDIVEALVLRDFNMSSEEFERRWNEIKSNPNVRPYDVYIKAREEFNSKDSSTK